MTANRPYRADLAVLLAPLLLAGCVGLSQFQLPVTTQSAVAHCAVGGIYASPDDEEDKKDDGVELIPLIDAGARVGITEFMDVGFRMGFYGFDFGVKVQLLDTALKVAFSPSIRPAINFDSFSALLPLLIGYMNEDVSISLSPIAVYSSKDDGRWGGGLSLMPMARVDDSWVGVEVVAGTAFEGDEAWSDIGLEAAVVYLLGF